MVGGMYSCSPEENELYIHNPLYNILGLLLNRTKVVFSWVTNSPQFLYAPDSNLGRTHLTVYLYALTFGPHSC